MEYEVLIWDWDAAVCGIAYSGRDEARASREWSDAVGRMAESGSTCSVELAAADGEDVLAAADFVKGEMARYDPPASWREEGPGRTAVFLEGER